jgi:hypothetical protein
MDFFALCAYMDLKFDDLYKMYSGKNILNKFRQDNGYKDGSYVKIWNGKEDNIHMNEILNKTNDISASELYVELEKKYTEIKSN